MTTRKHFVRASFAFAAGLAWLALPLSPACAQAGGQGIPDLSDFAGAIAKSVEAAPTGKAGAPSAGGFKSGLTVPSVKPGETARGIGRQLRTTIEKQSGPNPGLQQMEDGMPAMLSQIEQALVKSGFAKRDLGVAMAYAFLDLYETATKQSVPVAPSEVAAKTMATAVAKHWGPRFAALSPAAKESMYESLLISTTLNTAFAQQFAKAGKTQDEASIRQTSGQLFEKLIGVPPAQVKISPEGRITGLSAAPR